MVLPKTNTRRKTPDAERHALLPPDFVERMILAMLKEMAVHAVKSSTVTSRKSANALVPAVNCLIVA